MEDLRPWIIFLVQDIFCNTLGIFSFLGEGVLLYVESMNGIACADCD